jgi:hypothetical protein
VLPKANTGFTIDLKPGTEPMEINPYWVLTPELQELKVQLKGLLDLGLLRPSVFPWSSPINFIRKKDGSWRLCLTTIEYSLIAFWIFSQMMEDQDEFLCLVL